MRHCVFGASVRHCADRIAKALAVVNAIELKNLLDYDCVGDTYYYDFIVRENSFNVEIFVEGDDVDKLIDTCMCFARMLG